MALPITAGSAGEGKLFTLSGSNSAATPQIVANFTPGSGKGVGPGADGYPCNIYNVKRFDTDSTLIAAIVVNGLHGPNATSNNYYPLVAGESRDLQYGLLKNNIQLVSGYVLNSDGSASTQSIFMGASIVSRRES